MADQGAPANSEISNVKEMEVSSFEKELKSSQEDHCKMEPPNGYPKKGQNEAEVHKENINVVYIDQDDLTFFEHQVSGHGSMEKGLLKHKNGCILKPLQPPPMGTREISFYQKIFSNRLQPHEDCYAKLKQFVPKFYGISFLNSNNSSANVKDNETYRQFLLLDDIIEGFKKPCVADVKIGSQTWSPDATEAKIKQEMVKYKGTKFPLGICLTGMHFYDSRTSEKSIMTKDFCKSLEPLTLKLAIENFLNKNHSNLYRTLVKCMLKKLSQLEEVFNTQKSFKLYGSSILIAYDADYFSVETERRASEQDAELSLDLTDVPLRVFMIDFAHYHPSTVDDLSLDENYLFGLRNFMNILCDIIEEPRKYQ